MEDIVIAAIILMTIIGLTIIFYRKLYKYTFRDIMNYFKGKGNNENDNFNKRY